MGWGVDSFNAYLRATSRTRAVSLILPVYNCRMADGFWVYHVRVLKKFIAAPPAARRGWWLHFTANFKDWIRVLKGFAGLNDDWMGTRHHAVDATRKLVAAYNAAARKQCPDTSVAENLIRLLVEVCRATRIARRAEGSPNGKARRSTPYPRRSVGK